MTRWLSRVGLPAVLGIVTTALPLTAQRSLAIERFASDIEVAPDGTLLIAEQITARFTGSWNGIYRSIPIVYRNAQGFNWTLGLDVDGAVDAQGTPLRWEVSRERHYAKVKIWVPGARDVTRTITLRYRARNGLRFFDDHDELYWNVTGDEWDVALDSVDATVRLPAGAGGVRAIAFNGAYGGTAQDAIVAVQGGTIRATMPHALAFHEGLTVVVGWDKGLVAEPTSTARAFGFVRANWPLGLPLVFLILALVAWRRWGKDPEARPVAVQYEPPTGLTPCEAGTLIDHSVDMRDITATLVDLAVRGYIRLEEQEDSKLFGLVKDREYVIHRARDTSSWSELEPHERRVLEGMLGVRSTVSLSDLENEFYQELPGIRTAVFDRLLARRYYRHRPDRVQQGWVVGGMFVGVLIALGGAVVSRALLMTPVPFIVAGVLSGLILVVVGTVMPARTVAGARAVEQVLGFLEFLRRVETEHYEHIVGHPELFDKFLPYAMAFGVEKKWAKAFEGIYQEPPNWYVGPVGGPFHVTSLSSRLAGFTASAGTTMASSPRSSSGSGFGGGGFSGGGGGGGGGGGF